jgi:hypothetical protein
MENKPKPNHTIKFADVLNSDSLKNINKVFAEVFDVNIRLIDSENNYITKSENCSEFCRLIQSTEKGKKVCRESDINYLKKLKLLLNRLLINGIHPD